MGKSLGVEGGASAGPRPITGNFAGLFLIDQALQREPGRRMRGVGQAALERILARHAAALGVEVWRGVAAESFEDTGADVRVSVSGCGGPCEVEAAFLVGCDGARSSVRQRGGCTLRERRRGLDFPGTDPTITGLQGIVEVDHPERLMPLGWRRTATGMMAYGPRPGRSSVIEFARSPAARDAVVTAAEFEESLRRVSGADVRITALRSATRWSDHARQYRQGRVLRAGDAAHIHSAFGGQGLNLGLVGATNLGWKLAATIRGDAPEGLLDTYTTERHPVAASVLDNTRAQLGLMRPDPQTSALRQIVADLLTSYPDVNRHLGEMTSGVATRYDLGDDDPLVGRLVADRELTVDGVTTRLYSLMQGGRGLLVDGGAEAPELARAWTARVRVVKSAGARSLLDASPGRGVPGGCAPRSSAGSPPPEDHCAGPDAGRSGAHGRQGRQRALGQHASRGLATEGDASGELAFVSDRSSWPRGREPSRTVSLPPAGFRAHSGPAGVCPGALTAVAVAPGTSRGAATWLYRSRLPCSPRGTLRVGEGKRRTRRRHCTEWTDP